jgi:hypothetical protein
MATVSDRVAYKSALPHALYGDLANASLNNGPDVGGNLESILDAVGIGPL